jgi:hypothetical protein
MDFAAALPLRFKKYRSLKVTDATGNLTRKALSVGVPSSSTEPWRRKVDPPKALHYSGYWIQAVNIGLRTKE